ncbi:hypothetical protein ACTVCO_03595 [Sanguibacter sp. A247]|uniref:hypothetical protein n=1 Tax=unclassified Sanguibacter TaxID=2645534 RepID=UPI003FD6DF8D
MPVSPRRATANACAVLVPLGLVAASATTVVGAPLALTATLLVVSALGEPLLPRAVRALLRRASFGHSVRLAGRTALAALAVVAIAPDLLGATTALAAGTLIVRIVDNLAGSVLRSRRTTAIATRNLGDLPGTQLPAPALALVPLSTRAAVAEPLILGGVLLAAVSPAWLTMSVVALAGYGMLALLTGLVAVRLGRAGTAAVLMPVVRDAIDAAAPRVALYLSGDAASTYQADMWLATLERTAPDTIVVLRERAIMSRLAPTRLPVVCVPDATTLMALGLPTVRAALYPANVGKNIHLLREPHVLSAFIGHGDSDKNASFNPFTRVYDEVWVAGPAGRERYRRAQVGIVDSDVREVGRPQAARLAALPARSGSPVPTLLYAPTWEGWNQEQDYGSVEHLGVRLVEHLIASETSVRIIYRPHPFTGRRRPEVGAAHARIIAALAAANERAGHPAPAVADLVDEPDDALSREAAILARDTAWFAASPRAHMSVTAAAGVSMDACMAAADFLVTDISSVLSDWLATARPFGIAVPSHVAPDELAQIAPTATGGTLLLSDGTGWDEVRDLTLGTVPDVRAPERARLRTHLLGPCPAHADDTFAAAVHGIITRSEARLAALEAAGVPEQGHPLDDEIATEVPPEPGPGASGLTSDPQAGDSRDLPKDTGR